jgi:hypothetical protein
LQQLEEMSKKARKAHGVQNEHSKWVDTVRKCREQKMKAAS